MKNKKIISMVLTAIMTVVIFTNTIYASETANVDDVEQQAIWPEGPVTESASAILIEASTGTILYEKNVNQEFYPASITKIMTTLLALEHSSMDEIVTFSYNSVHKIEGTHIARDTDEQMTMEQCLYAVMLGSANEVSYAVAEHIGGDYDTFIKMMNEKAKELGCKNTNFSNPHGLPDENHYTSAYDMALISQAAYANETFRNITGTKKYVIPPTNKHIEETPITNHHKMLYSYKGDKNYLNEYCVGGKTGYTSVALSTLVTFAQKDGMDLICVVMKASGNNHWLDSTNLIQWGFENFKEWNVAENETNFGANNESIFALSDNIFGNVNQMLTLNEKGSIILPAKCKFTDAAAILKFEDGNKNTLGILNYMYGEKPVGSVTIDISQEKVKKFNFVESQEVSKEEASKEEASKEEQPKVVTINIKRIGIIVLCIFGAIGLVLLGIYIKKNYHTISRGPRWGRRRFRWRR